MVKLKKPVLCEVDENYFVSAADFRSYAHCMMYPDPVGIVMSGKLNDIVTGAVNDGKLTIKEAFDKLVKRNAPVLSIIATAMAQMDTYRVVSFWNSVMKQLQPS